MALPKITITVRLDPAVYAKAVVKAKDQGVSLNQLIADLLQSITT